jgi:hypothetical protein
MVLGTMISGVADLYVAMWSTVIGVASLVVSKNPPAKISEPLKSMAKTLVHFGVNGKQDAKKVDLGACNQ